MSKMGRVVPLLKLGKRVTKVKSYQPIYLLPTLAKPLKALLLPAFTHHLSPTHISMASAEYKVPQQLFTLVALDLSKALEMVNHLMLLSDIEESLLPPGLKRWILVYLSCRQPSVEFRG